MRRLRPETHFVCLALLTATVVAGCAADPPITLSCPPLSADPAATFDCAQIGLAVAVSEVTTPGVGVVSRMRVEGLTGGIMAADVSQCFHVAEAQGCMALPTSIARSMQPSQVTLLVAPGSDPAASQRAADAATAIMQQLPAGTRIATFRWGRRVTQLRHYTTDLSILVPRLAEALGTEAAPLPAGTALASLVRDVVNVAPRTVTGVRALIVVAPDLSLGAVDVPVELEPVRVQWLVAERTADSVVLEDHVVTVGTDAAMAATTTADRVAAVIGDPLYEVGACTTGAAPVFVQVEGTDLSHLATPVPLASFPLGAVCDPATLVPVQRPDIREIEFVFTPAESAIYASRATSRDKVDFAVSVRLGRDAAPVPALAHLRGQSSLWCERPNYTVNLQGNGDFPLVNGATGDEFYLLAMCLDDRYVNQFTADQLMAGLGLFPMAFDMLPLTVDGRNQGVYLMIQKPHDYAVENQSRVRSVLRRPLDADVPFPAEVKFAAWTPAKALADYVSFRDAVGATVRGVDLEAQLRRRMDLDQYLRWIALMTLLGNGDYVDELFVLSTETTDAAGQAIDYFSSITWDPDDLFSTCHHGGRFAFVDPYGLIYCSEALIDHAMFSDPHVYGIYVDILDDLIERRVTAAVFNATVDQTLDTLLPHFADPDVRSAMIELLTVNPGASVEAEAVRDIRAAGDAMKASFLVRQAELRAGILAYRMAP